MGLYEYKIALFDNGEPEELFLFIHNFHMNLETSGTLTAGAKIQYICMLVRVKALSQLGKLSVEVVILTTRRGMRKLHELKVRSYDARLIYINEYLSAFNREKSSENA